MRRPPKPLAIALALYGLGSIIGMLVASHDDSNDDGTVAGGAVVGVLATAVLWLFAARRHRWPRWVLLVLIVVAIGAEVAFLDLRSLLAVVDALALIVLLRGWSAIQEYER